MSTYGMMHTGPIERDQLWDGTTTSADGIEEIIQFIIDELIIQNPKIRSDKIKLIDNAGRMAKCYLVSTHWNLYVNEQPIAFVEYLEPELVNFMIKDYSNPHEKTYDEMTYLVYDTNVKQVKMCLSNPILLDTLYHLITEAVKSSENLPHQIHYCGRSAKKLYYFITE